MRGVGRVLCAGIGAVCIGIPAAAQDEPDTAKVDDDPKNWELRVGLGGSLRAGDENNYSGAADGMLRRFWDEDTVTWTAFGNYGKTGGDRDTEDFGTKLEWRHDFTERFFWLTGSSADHDAVQGRNLRLQAYSGPGYRIWQQSKKEFFDVSSGLGYRHERFRGDEPNNDLFDLRAGYRYEDVIAEVLEIVHFTDTYTPLNDVENFLVKSELQLAVPLFEGLHFTNNARYEYVNDPADGSEHSNFWLTIGLQYRL